MEPTLKNESEKTVRGRASWVLLCAGLFAAGCDGVPVIGGAAVLNTADGGTGDVAQDAVPDATDDVAKDAGGDASMDARPARCATNADCAGDPAGGTCNPATGACQSPCASNADCAGNPTGNICDTGTGLCTMRCGAHSDCTGQGAGDICNPTTRMCTNRCAGDADCVGHPNGTTCNPMTGACVAPCRSNVDCTGNPAGAVCDPTSGLCSSTCRSHADCAGMAGTICNPTSRTCTDRCAGDADCAGHPGGAVCDTASGACVQCVASSDTCSPEQHCDPMSNACVAGCRSDEGCPRMGSPDGDAGPGVQLHCNVTTRTCEACVTDAHCPTGQRCSAGACVMGCSDDSRCAAGERCCGGACVNPQSNDQNCGGCGTVCTSINGDPGCSDGVCTISRCSAPFGNCDDRVANGCETNTNTSVAHCGRCGNACPTRAHASSSCDTGTCAFTCEAGFADCNGDAEDGCETDLNGSAGNCGACGRTCTVAEGSAVCAMGACAVGTCNAGNADCDGVVGNGCEVNTRSTLAHCGACGRACAAPANGSAACAAGACVVGSCNAGFGDCDDNDANGCEVNLNTTPGSCGACGRACVIPNGSAGCEAGACTVAACNAGFGDCDGNPANGCETNLNTTPGSCGACGRGCSVSNGTAGCAAGACTVAACATGFADCDGNPANGCEVNTLADVDHCGACGDRCVLPGGTNACVRGGCVVTACAAGLGDCDDDDTNGCETSISGSLSNCGACGTVCRPPTNGTASCVAGACGVASCNAGFGNCDGNAANGCETSTLTTVAHCGGCGRACATRPNTVGSCAAGACAYACVAGFADCDGNAANGCEVNVAADTSNCGACRTACPAATGGGASCTAGVCGQTCPAGQSNCAGTCRAVATDANNCGACGRVCSFPNGSATCAAGTCTLGACATGFGNCDGNPANGCETDLRTTVGNCGACGTVCTSPSGGAATCTSGVCGASCGAGSTNCSGVCVNLQTSNSNCGACGRACGASQACVNAVCVGQGSLRFTMTWDTNGDMDLHLLPPCGTEIYYGRLSACGGTLDRDDTSVRGPENIFWPGTFTPGTYQVCPEAYSSSVANANYTLTVVRNGVTVHTSTGRRGRTDGNTACTASFPGVVTLSL